MLAWRMGLGLMTVQMIKGLRYENILFKWELSPEKKIMYNVMYSTAKKKRP